MKIKENKGWFNPEPIRAAKIVERAIEKSSKYSTILSWLAIAISIISLIIAIAK